VHVKTKWRWKRVGVGEEKPTKTCIKLVLALLTGQGIMPNAVGNVSFEIDWELSDCLVRYGSFFC